MNLGLVFGMSILFLMLLAAVLSGTRRSGMPCHRCPGYAMKVCVPPGERWENLCPKQCELGTTNAQCPDGRKICLPVNGDPVGTYNEMCGIETPVEPVLTELELCFQIAEEQCADVPPTMKPNCKSDFILANSSNQSHVCFGVSYNL